jgi:hypothetical protein
MQKILRNMAITAALVVFTSRVALAEQCVSYVKRVMPAYNTTYFLKTDHSTKAKKYSWVPANDLWNRLWVTSRGSDPAVGAAFIIDKSNYLATYKDPITGKTVTTDVGHTGKVTGVSKDKKAITVAHSNWDKSETSTTGTFTRSSVSSTTWYYTTSAGVKWKTGYTISGFIYTP